MFRNLDITNISYWYLTFSLEVKVSHLFGGECQEEEEFGQNEGGGDSDGAPHDDDGDVHSVCCADQTQRCDNGRPILVIPEG